MCPSCSRSSPYPYSSNDIHTKHATDHPGTRRQQNARNAAPQRCRDAESTLDASRRGARPAPRCRPWWSRRRRARYNRGALAGCLAGNAAQSGGGRAAAVHGEQLARGGGRPPLPARYERSDRRLSRRKDVAGRGA
eukprot:5177092-Prymnesium_polylepis.1